MTKHRELILKNLQTRRDHPTAKMVYESTIHSVNKMSFATVYNSLEYLVSMGLIKRLSIDSEVTRYDAVLESHSHLICDSCGMVQDVPPIHLPEPIDQSTWNGFEAREYQVVIRGNCQHCQH